MANGRSTTGRPLPHKSARDKAKDFAVEYHKSLMAHAEGIAHSQRSAVVTDFHVVHALDLVHSKKNKLSPLYEGGKIIGSLVLGTALPGYINAIYYTPPKIDEVLVYTMLGCFGMFVTLFCLLLPERKKY